MPACVSPGFLGIVALVLLHWAVAATHASLTSPAADYLRVTAPLPFDLNPNMSDLLGLMQQIRDAQRPNAHLMSTGH